MTRSELARFDGREGRRAYAAVNGKVYDFTDSPRWKDGDHEKQHRAGCDLSRDLESAPHIRVVIERFPVVGALEEETASPAGKGMKALAVGVIVLILIVILFLIMR
ncbi:cytochrome b5 domain-containing protein [Desulfuromonas sp. TF]|uniref:cytochrome b5 domain-containing protein n=1 Tax=Desulfuromonas sp. TF TaxID=1232410 RepID=UPI0004011BAC|nr:cytochrome b5 domain-containing protein [Desulfuromonas sp. TF]